MERSVFVSYAREDSSAVHHDADLLRAGGVRVFIDVRDIDFGDRWRDVLTRAIASCERVLVFWSAAARLSEWVEREWRLALSLGKKIVPTLLDRTPLPPELAEFQCLRRFGYEAPRPAAVAAPGPVRPAPRSASWVGRSVAAGIGTGLVGLATVTWSPSSAALVFGAAAVLGALLLTLLLWRAVTARRTRAAHQRPAEAVRDRQLAEARALVEQVFGA